MAGNHPTAVRFVARNHPSVCVADSSPQRGATANIRWRYWRPLRGDSPRGGEMSRSDRGDGALFALSPKVTEGWFPVQNLRQHRTIPALRLKHRSGGCGTASALPKCSIIHKVLSALLA